MKIHNDFTLYFRVVPSGKRVVYYYAYDENGKRTYGRSTGETTLTAARRKCNQLFREGALAMKKGYIPTFAEYAEGWWDWDFCPYLQNRRKRYNITQSYAAHAKRCMDKVLLPHFGAMRMDRITREEIERFMDKLVKNGLKNTSVNSYYTTLKTMMVEAAEREVIAKDPTAKILKLVNDSKAIKIITQDEFKKLFVGDWHRVWENNRIAYTANKLAALTGMRAGEVMGLKGEFVYEGHLFLCKQYDRFGYRDTKTKTQTNIPLPASLIDDLNELKKANGDGFLFSDDGGGKPMCRETVLKSFRQAMMNIGISKEDITDRKLHFHSWRHFFNTELLKGGLSIQQVQAITRHKSERMTELYSHFDPTEFVKAKEVQEALLKPVETKAPNTEGQRATVLAFPAHDAEPELLRKQA